MNPRIEGVLFDWGGVLIDNPAPGLMQYCAQSLGVSTERYIQVHKAHGEPFQKGHIPENVFWQRVCEALCCAEPQSASLWADAFRSVYCPKEEIWALVEQLRAGGYKVGLLSNTEPACVAYFDELQYDNKFDAWTFSCVEGTAKPEPQIYEIAAGKLGVECAQCVFIDDSQTYIDGAVATQLKGIVFDSAEQVRQSLQALGVTIS